MNAKPKQAKGEALTFKRGNVSVKIYTVANRAKVKSGEAKRYNQYTLVYYSGNQRVKRNFSDLGEAKAEAELVANKLANGDSEVLKLTANDRAIYIQACELLKPLNTPLNLAVAEYSSAMRLLPPGVPLRRAVEFYVQRNPASMSAKQASEIVIELVKTKREAGRSDVYIKDLEGRLNRFAASFKCPIANITGRQVDEFIRGLGLSGRSQNNHRRLIALLFSFAIRRGYLPKDHSEMEAVEKADQSAGEIEIFSSAELRLVLAHARSEMIPWLVIGAFAGLRHAELQRLEWKEVNLSDRFIEVTAGKAKTASRRLVPISDNLASWLAPYIQPAGRITSFDNMSKQINWLVEDVNAAALKRQAEASSQDLSTLPAFAWKHNGLRHSFISYRVAVVKDVGEVALEAGNSTRMIFQHYRQLVTQKEGLAWFAILPENDLNILPLPANATVNVQG